MTFPYRLHAVSEFFVGDIQIQLIEPGELPRVYWQCELPGSKEGQLDLLEPLDKQRFVAATSRGAGVPR